MRLFRDGRGLLRRVRWVRVIAVTAAFGAGVSWVRPEPEAAPLEALKTIRFHSCTPLDDPGTLDYGSLVVLSNTTRIGDVLTGETKQGYVFVDECLIPTIPTRCPK